MGHKSTREFAHTRYHEQSKQAGFKAAGHVYKTKVQARVMSERTRLQQSAAKGRTNRDPVKARAELLKIRQMLKPWVKE